MVKNNLTIRDMIEVEYNSDKKSFKISWTTESKLLHKVPLVTDTQKSNIQVGRYALDATGSVVDAADYFSGDNNLLGVGYKDEAEFTAGKGLSATPAKATGATVRNHLMRFLGFLLQTAKISLTSRLMVLAVLSLYHLVFMWDQPLQKP